MSVATIISFLNASTPYSGATQLSTPTLTATVVSDSQIALSWTNVSNESSYQLERSPNGSTGWTQIGGTIAANTTSYNDTGLTASTHYYYRLKAVGDGSTYTDSNYSTDDDTTDSTFTPLAGVDGETVNGADKPSLHKYTGFPWVAGLSDGHVVSGYKESANHAAAGPFMFGDSDGSLTFNYAQVNVPGYGLVTCSNLSLGVLSDDTIIISWQTDAETSQMFFAWSNNRGATWHYIGGITYHTAADIPGNTGYYAAQFGKPVEMPSGKVLQPFYDAPVNGTDAQHAKFVEISADLTALSIGNTISTQTGGTFPNGQHSEVFVVITENTGVDATCKMVAIQRNEQYEAFTHYHSSNGGATWTRNDTYLLNVLTDGTSEKYPVSDIVLKDGLFYIFVGIRKLTDYYEAYSTVSPTDLYNNTAAGYSALTRFADCSADSNGATIDCGYPTAVVRQFPAQGIDEILVQYYDTNATWSGSGEKEERIVQKIVLAP